MTATVAQVMTGLKTQLSTISGLRVVDTIPDVINPPVAIPALIEVRYHGAQQQGMVEHTVTVSLVVARISERTAQQTLYGYLSSSGATSVRAAIEADRTLGGVVQTCIVRSGSNIQSVSVGDQTYLVVDFDVLAYA
jgi:hypothetical protein